MHVYKPPRVGGLDRVPVFTAGTGSTRADLFELDGVTPMPDNVLVADTSGNLPSFQCATSPVYVGVSGSRTTWTPSESGEPSAASSAIIAWCNPVNGDDFGGTPSYPVFDSQDDTREQTLGGRVYLNAGNGLGIQFIGMKPGFTLAYANIFVADATSTNTAWYAITDPTAIVSTQNAPLNRAGGATSGSGVALNVAGDLITVTSAGVYDFRITIGPTSIV